MEQKSIWKNLTGTALVLGLAISTMSFNSTLIVGSNIDNIMHNKANSEDIHQKKNSLEAEAKLFFGQMREATLEESASVNNYIETISKDTGVNFFDLC